MQAPLRWCKDPQMPSPQDQEAAGIAEDLAAGTVVVGLDGRDGGRDALALAHRLADALGARLLLAHAYPYESDLPRGSHAAFELALREPAEEMLRAAAAGEGVEADVLAVPDVHPARALHRIADGEDAVLLVVGSSHRGPIGRALIGDVARGTLHGAACPVAVAPRGTAGRSIDLRRVGVGFDGSAEAEHALEVAVHLARRTAGALELVGVVVEPEIYTPVYAVGIDWTSIIEERRDLLQATLDEAVGRAGVPASARAVVGRPVPVLEDSTEQLDLLVVGSRSFGPVRRVLLGTTSDQLVNRASCPVVVVPRGAGAEQGGEPAAGAAAARG
jgi:nucleotide-binding universal stress UspA family protein